ncbi:MAG: PaaI family thioesterase [Akkermansiaceae bacterium]|nr:PaaI family thioesterase [Akkermansiaceae bacterium]
MNSPTHTTPPDKRHTLRPLDLDLLTRLREKHHRQCHACSHQSLRLEFETDGVDTLIGRITPPQELCSYPNVLHGGIISLFIDEAMTCCLMGHGVLGLTGELSLRFHQSVETCQLLEIKTRVIHARRPLYQLESHLSQNGNIMVSAKAKFMQKPDQTSLT